jgi:predicted nucleic acid-binding protein
MILVDTSVVIDYAKGHDAKLQALLPTLPVVLCGITRAEVLHGARDPAHRQKLLTLLGTFGQVPIPDPLWDIVGDHLAALRAGGVTVAFQDVVIATVALVNDFELWTRDQHFTLVQGILPALKLFQEPP